MDYDTDIPQRLTICRFRWNVAT